MIKNSSTILMVDDDDEILELTSNFLATHHYKILTAKDAFSAYSTIAKEPVDLVILDINLPGEDGIAICQKLRKQNNLPIIMLTASQEKVDLLLSLGMGADHYLTKPFDEKILLAYVKSALRRNSYSLNSAEQINNLPAFPSYNFGPWVLKTATRQLFSENQTEIILTAAEYELLLLFILSPQRVLSRDQLSESLHNRENFPYDRSIDVLVSRLRQ